MDDYAQTENVRKNEGAVGIFTNGLINRSEMFSHIMNLLVGQFHYQKASNK
jgi:non-canonical (house-cleaning) NTP pyrophosphatase